MGKIDFVIIWVDGSDPEWLAEKEKYSSGEYTDNRDIRYRDWNNLRYWFRGVELYAPWVNNIFFVTWGHLPSWLNTDNEKLKIIRHTDFIPKEYLPTFSSHVIELNLHRIPGLSEEFVYFNDDIFLMNLVKPEDFFVNGKPADSAILSPAIMENKYGIGNVELNNMGIINTYFDKREQMSKDKNKWFNFKYEPSQVLKNYLLFPWHSFTSFYEFHIENSFLKSTFQTVWNKEDATLTEVCHHRFRDLKLDNNQWLIRDWQLASNNFEPRSTKFGKLFTLKQDTNVKNMILKSPYKSICINDSEDINQTEFELLKRKLNETFQIKFPKKSTFEK